MNKLIKKVLNKIENEGYEAYVVGGYVRDLLLGKTSYDVDITTNAKPKELLGIFPNASAKNLGGISFKIKEYNFEITTYREEITYSKRKPVKYNYITNLLTDLERRDFTINSICLNSKGDIIDVLNGIEDLNNLTIKVIGDAKKKFSDDPLRLLRAVRFATILNFRINDDDYAIMKTLAKNILDLSNTRIKEELDKILLSPNCLKGLDYLTDLGITRMLGITYESVIPVFNLDGMYAQIDITYNLPFTSNEKKNIMAIKSILETGSITEEALYNNGLYISLIAGDILGIDKVKINKMDKSLRIHNKKDIKITADEIKKVLNISDGKELGNILKEIESKILNKELDNKKSAIIKYIKTRG